MRPRLRALLGRAIITSVDLTIHAAIRWQRGRPFKASDFYDMYHAAAALPYCDMFLTEAFMGTILKNPPLSFGTLFDTDIVWDEADALQLLRAL